MTFRFRFILLAACLIGFWSAPVTAQLAEDVRDVFESMLDDLDDDLSRKFRRAIRLETATIEFTPDQFRRFRDNPINPFDGLEEIDASDSAGNIALKFELPSLRNRPIGHWERQHDSLKQNLRSSVTSGAASTVAVLNEDRDQVALGIVVDENGLILTKASEVENEKSLQCRFSDYRHLPAKVIRVDKGNDVALLSVAATGLTPVKWASTQPVLGAFVLTPDVDGSVLMLGTYSARPRSTRGGKQAFLGVKPETTPRGVVIYEVRPGNASYEAGLMDGDIILKMGDVAIKDVTDLVRQIRSKQPGDQIAIEYMRNGVVNQVRAKLSGMNMNGARAARFKMMNRLGTIPSRRGDGFPLVFQHDSPLFPNQCGGPIVDLEGNVLGMNIARNGRVASFSIPSQLVQTIVEDLKRQSLAARAGDAVKN